MRNLKMEVKDRLLEVKILHCGSEYPRDEIQRGPPAGRAQQLRPIKLLLIRTIEPDEGSFNYYGFAEFTMLDWMSSP